MSSTKNDNRLVRLESLLARDAKALETTLRFLRQDGFIFLELTGSPLATVMTATVHDAGAYLRGPGRGQGSRVNLHGHVSSKYKDSFRLLTGNQFQSNKLSSSELPPSIPGVMVELAERMDDTAVKIANVLAEPLFGVENLAQLGQRYNLPLLHPNPYKNKTYGLLDIVCYHRTSDDNDEPCPEIVVSAHQDPGLFVLALPSSAPGLELWDDVEGSWVAPPPEVGLVWAGRAARDCLTPCVHRVRLPRLTGDNNDDPSPRIACWHEVCTADQISAPLMERLKERGEELALEGGDTDENGNSSAVMVGTQGVLDFLRRAEDHKVGGDSSETVVSSRQEQPKLRRRPTMLQQWTRPYQPNASPPRGLSSMKVETRTVPVKVRTQYRNRYYGSGASIMERAGLFVVDFLLSVGLWMLGWQKTTPREKDRERPEEAE